MSGEEVDVLLGLEDAGSEVVSDTSASPETKTSSTNETTDIGYNVLNSTTGPVLMVDAKNMVNPLPVNDTSYVINNPMKSPTKTQNQVPTFNQALDYLQQDPEYGNQVAVPINPRYQGSANPWNIHPITRGYPSPNWNRFAIRNRPVARQKSPSSPKVKHINSPHRQELSTLYNGSPYNGWNMPLQGHTNPQSSGTDYVKGQMTHQRLDVSPQSPKVKHINNHKQEFIAAYNGRNMSAKSQMTSVRPDTNGHGEIEFNSSYGSTESGSSHCSVTAMIWDQRKTTRPVYQDIG